jgi:hypothetical protein
MRLILEINSSKLLLTPEQATQIADILHGCEYVEHKYTGSTTATAGVSSKSIYMDFIKPAVMRDVIKVGVMSQIDYDALVLITKLQGES